MYLANMKLTPALDWDIVHAVPSMGNADITSCMGKYNYTYWYLKLRTKEEVNYLSFDSLCMFNVVCAAFLYRLAACV